MKMQFFDNQVHGGRKYLYPLIVSINSLRFSTITHRLKRETQVRKIYTYNYNTVSPHLGSRSQLFFFHVILNRHRELKLKQIYLENIAISLKANPVDELLIMMRRKMIIMISYVFAG